MKVFGDTVEAFMDQERSMLVKVMYTDGTTGMVRAVKLPGLLESGRAVGFQGGDGWVEVRREPLEGDTEGYRGPERRKRRPLPSPDPVRKPR